MKRPKKFMYHSLVFILCGTLLVNSIGASASIEEASNEVWKTQESIASENTIGDLSLEQLASKILLDEEIPELLSIESVKQNNHVNRLYNQETDLSSVIFQNRDGSKTLYSFGAPVKYVDDDGVIRDKSNSLTEPGEKPEVAYVNEENDIKTYFPKSLNSSQGIVLEAKDIRIEMVPIAGIGTIETINGEIPEIANIDDTNKIISEQKYSSSESVLNLQLDANPSTALKSNALNLADRTTDTVVFDQVFGKGTKIIYTPDFNGFKEDIILDYYTGHNEFTFLIKTGGLTLLKENEVISFYDSLTGEKMGNLGELLIYDSSNNFDKTEYEHHYKVNESIPNEEYYVTIVVDQEFLTSQNTIYPVVVDPVLVIDNSLTGANYIQDASLWSKQPNTVYNTASMRLGYDTSTTGSYRIVMKSNNLISNMSVIPASPASINITSAYLSVNHVDNYLGDTMLVDAHPVTKAWEETTVTSGTLWSNYGSSTYSNNYYNGGPNGWRNYYITTTVKSWKSGASSNNGIMLKARYESSPRQWIAIAASEYSTTSARPYIVINYNTVVYSETTGIFNNGIYYIKNRNSEKYLDVSGAGIDNGTNVIQYSFHGLDNQKWKVVYYGTGLYRFQPMHTTGKYLEVASYSDTNSINVDISNASLNRQLWNIQSNGNGSYRILSECSSLTKGLTVEGASTLSGANVFQYTYTGSGSDDNDDWILEGYYSVPQCLIPQQMDNWCWAASAEMLAKIEDFNFTRTQQNAVDHIFPPILGQSWNIGGTRGQQENAAEFITNDTIDFTHYDNQIYSEETIVKLIRTGYPIGITRGYYDGLLGIRTGGHATVIYRYYYNSIYDDMVFHILDPWQVNFGDIYPMSYSEIVSENTTKWDGIVVRNVSIANNVINMP